MTSERNVNRLRAHVREGSRVLFLLPRIRTDCRVTVQLLEELCGVVENIPLGAWTKHGLTNRIRIQLYITIILRDLIEFYLL